MFLYCNIWYHSKQTHESPILLKIIQSKDIYPLYSWFLPVPSNVKYVHTIEVFICRDALNPNYLSFYSNIWILNWLRTCFHSYNYWLHLRAYLYRLDLMFTQTNSFPFVIFYLCITYSFIFPYTNMYCIWYSLGSSGVYSIHILLLDLFFTD